MTKEQLLDKLVANGLGTAEALAEINRIMAAAQLLPKGKSVTYSLRHNDQPIVTITKR